MLPPWERVPGVPGAILTSVLSAADCAALVRTTTAAYAPKRSRRPGPAIRTNERMLHTPDAGLLRQVDDALRPLFAQGVFEVETGWVPAEGFVNPRWRMNRYTPGQAFFPHFDSGHAFAANHRSLYSVILYLDEEFEGGETVFFPGGHRRDGMPPNTHDAEEVVVKARRGWALVFPHYGPDNPRHEGREISSGIKHIARTDLVFEAPAFPLKAQIFGPHPRLGVLLLGQQGAGKTTLAPALAKHLHAQSLRFGSEVRRHRAEGTPLGKKLLDAKGPRNPGEARRPGGFLSDALAAEVVQAAMPTTPAVVLDGYPRTRTQSLFFESRDWQTLALHLQCTEREARLTLRGREGDDGASQAARDTDWQVHTEPLIAHYAKRGELVAVDGDGAAEGVADRAARAVWNALLDRWREALPSGLPWSGECDGRDHSSNPRTRVFNLGDRFLKFSLDPMRTHWNGPVPTAEVLAAVELDGMHVAVLKRLPGCSLKDLAPTATDAEKHRWCQQLAHLLRQTHTPAPRGPDLWAQAESQVDTVPMSNFGPRYGLQAPRSRDELRERLQRLHNPMDPPVHLHGDPCVPNWLVEDGQISGTLDLTAPATGPAGWDVALTAWSVGHNFGPSWSRIFETAYGFEGDLSIYRELVRFLA